MQERRLAVIMFTDIVGYTALMGSDEDRAFEILHTNREIHTKLIDQFDGTLIKEMGDGMLISFNLAADAVHCSIEIQKRARKELESRIRIGIHLGDIIFENEDVFGDGVNIASRLQSITDPGGIYISESLQKSIRAKSDIQTTYLGEFILKNVGYPIKTYSIQDEDLPVPSSAKIKKLLGRSWKETMLRSVYTYVILLALLLSNGWWIRNAFFINTSQISSLIVLPFDNFTGSDTLDYFVKGMHDALIGDVGKISALRVPSKRTANAYRNVDKSIPEIASELGIDAAVETSVSCFGDNICFKVRLVSVFPEETQLWSDDFYIEKSQLSNLSKRLAKEISKQINVLLTPGEEKMLADSRPIDHEAYEAYLRGMSYLELATKADVDRALGYFELARDIDPNYALAYLGISLVWGSYAQHGFMSSNEAMPKVEEARGKALEMDSSLVQIHAWLATGYTWVTWEWELADREYQKAIEINPNYAFAQAYYSHYLAIMGDPEKGLPHGEVAIKLDPFNTLYQSVHGQALKNARKYDEALDLLLKLYDTEPDQGVGLPALLAVYHELGKYDEALGIAKKIYALKGNDAANESLEAGNNEGGYKMAWQRTAEMMINYSDTTYFPPWQICTLYCRAGMKEDALNWLEKAFQDHDLNIPYISVDPLFDFLREDVRFINILQKMKLPG